MTCFKCGVEVDLRQPHVTIEKHVERHRRFLGGIKIIDEKTIRIYCMNCGRDLP